MSDSKESSVKKIGIYCGSFNPYHKGHQNIFEKAEAIFGEDNVIIAVGINPEKFEKHTLGNKLTESYVPDRDRAATIKRNFPNITVENYNTFIHEYVIKKEQEGFDVTVIRGLRNGDDLNYEVNQLRYIQDFKPDIKVVFIQCDPAYSHISSSAIRKLNKMVGGEAGMHKYLAKKED